MKIKALSEQTALVTGGATGIGRAFTEALLENGIGAVIIASRRQSVLDEAARELNQKFGDGKVLSYAFDVRNRAETENLVRFALEKRGAIDVLINNSGLAVPETVTEITDAG
jgi:NADP-dependent 3-hydroxy acid dehydrogenase YdfG